VVDSNSLLWALFLSKTGGGEAFSSATKSVAVGGAAREHLLKKPIETLGSCQRDNKLRAW